MKIAREGGLIRLSLDRPDQRNVLTPDDCALIVETLGDAVGNAVLIESTGPVFCGGMEAGCDPGALFAESTWRRSVDMAPRCARRLTAPLTARLTGRLTAPERSR